MGILTTILQKFLQCLAFHPYVDSTFKCVLFRMISLHWRAFCVKLHRVTMKEAEDENWLKGASGPFILYTTVKFDF